jgi:DnaJ-class molecular chaperone
MTELAQLTLEQLRPCPACKGTGLTEQPLTRIPDSWMAQTVCRVCKGAGTVAYDPDDHTEIPF